MPRGRLSPAAASRWATYNSSGPRARWARATFSLRIRTAPCGPSRRSSAPETPAVNQRDLRLGAGRRLHIYDSLPDAANAHLAIVWHHGTPNLGEPPEPLLPAAAERGIRWVSYDRPGYGGSSPHPGRDVASAASDVSAIADALGIARFAVLGHSGGAAHALACGALLSGRVMGAVSVSGLAPFDAVELDWFAGMGAAGAAELRAASEGRTALESYLAATEFDPEMFTAADHAALKGPWSWLGKVAGRAPEGGIGRVCEGRPSD